MQKKTSSFSNILTSIDGFSRAKVTVDELVSNIFRGKSALVAMATEVPAAI